MGTVTATTRTLPAVLQARVAFRNDFIASLTYDDEHHRVVVLNAPGSPAPDPEAAGVDHIAYTYGDLGQLLSTYRWLKASGIEPARCINHGPRLVASGCDRARERRGQRFLVDQSVDGEAATLFRDNTMLTKSRAGASSVRALARGET